MSWSSLSPYRLATVGSDGLARMWDIREAALKRYGAQVGKRLDYLLPLTDTEKGAFQEEPPLEATTENNLSHNSVPVPVLPPLPLPDNEPRIEHAAADVSNPSLGSRGEAQVNVPPLPPGAGAGLIQGEAGAGSNQGEAGAAGRSAVAEGSFVANNAIDEGVRLIAKLQHGDTVEDQPGPATRSSRKAVKVICVARCPIGGHFVTGSDDGLARIWADEDDDRIEVLDQRYLDHKEVRSRKEIARRQATRKSARVNSMRCNDSDGAFFGVFMSYLKYLRLSS